MIPHSSIQCQSEKVTVQDLSTDNWQRELSRSQITVESLFRQLEFNAQQQQQFLRDHEIPKNFPLRVTQSFVDRIRKSDPEDPLLKQILPGAEELVEKLSLIHI